MIAGDGSLPLILGDLSLYTFGVCFIESLYGSEVSDLFIVRVICLKGGNKIRKKIVLGCRNGKRKKES